MSLLANHGIIGVNSLTPIITRIDTASGTGTGIISAAFNTPALEGEFILIVAFAVQDRVIPTPSGFTRLHQYNNTIDGTTFIFYKVAGPAESNSYDLDYGGLSTNWAWYAAKWKNVNPTTPVAYVGGNNGTGTNYALNASSVNVNMTINQVLVATLGGDNTISAVSFSNSFVSESPASGSTYRSVAHRIYTSDQAAQNTSITITGTMDSNTHLFIINPAIV